jgi:hypothetical protein
MSSRSRVAPATPLTMTVQRFRRHPLAVPALVTLAILAVAAAIAPLLANLLGIDLDAVDLFDRFAPASAHIRSAPTNWDATSSCDCSRAAGRRCWSGSLRRSHRR